MVIIDNRLVENDLTRETLKGLDFCKSWSIEGHSGWFGLNFQHAQWPTTLSNNSNHLKSANIVISPTLLLFGALMVMRNMTSFVLAYGWSSEVWKNALDTDTQNNHSNREINYLSSLCNIIVKMHVNYTDFVPPSHAIHLFAVSQPPQEITRNTIC